MLQGINSGDNLCTCKLSHKQTQSQKTCPLLPTRKPIFAFTTMLTFQIHSHSLKRFEFSCGQTKKDLTSTGQRPIICQKFHIRAHIFFFKAFQKVKFLLKESLDPPNQFPWPTTVIWVQTFFRDASSFN